MSEAIKVGDLVMVVRGHPCVIDMVSGIPFRVSEIRQWPNALSYCTRCGEKDIYFGGRYYTPFRAANVPLAWLKRIDTEPETVEQRDEEPVHG